MPTSIRPDVVVHLYQRQGTLGGFYEAMTGFAVRTESLKGGL